MKLVYLNLKNLYSKNISSAIMIFLTVVMGSFALCFSIGILHNNKYAALEDELSTQKIDIIFNNSISYGDNEDIFIQIYEIFGNTMKEAMVLYDSNKGGAEGDEALYSSSFSFSDGIYKTGYTVNNIMSYQVKKGRNLNDDDFEHGRKVALVYEEKECDRVFFGGEEYEVVGLRNIGSLSASGNNVILPISAWGSNPIGSLHLSLERLPFKSEQDKLYVLLENNFSGMYEIYEFDRENVDMTALYRTIGVAMIGIIIVVAVTMGYLIQYIYESRRYQVAVYRLSGCRIIKAVGFFMQEALLLIIPPAVTGTFIFSALKRSVLDRYYLYLSEISWMSVYVKIVVLMTATLGVLMLVLCLRLMFRPVKEEITEVR